MQCPYCKKEFKKTHNVQLYCTKECCSKARKERFLTSNTKVCRHCKKQFESTKTWQKYCSLSCRKKATKEDRRIKETSRKCPECERIFFASHKARIFCSVECKRISWDRANGRSEKTLKIIPCQDIKSNRITKWNEALKFYWKEYGCTNKDKGNI